MPRKPRPQAAPLRYNQAPRPAFIDLGPDAPPIERHEQSPHGAQLQIEAKDGADRLCLLGHDFELFFEAAVAERNGSADPEALALRGRNLVAHPLADDLALKLRKREQNVEREPAHAGGGVEGLGDRHEGHAVLVEQLDQLGEVGEGAGETVDLIDHNDGDLAGPDNGQKLLQGRAVERGSGTTAIVVAVGNQAPALMRLALDIGLAGFPLGIERIELEIEIMLARLAGIDRAALGIWNDRLHDLGSLPPRFAVAGAALPLGRCLATARRDLMPAVRARGRPLGAAGGTSAV